MLRNLMSKRFMIVVVINSAAHILRWHIKKRGPEWAENVENSHLNNKERKTKSYR
jgi:hypothetical protein